MRQRQTKGINVPEPYMSRRHRLQDTIKRKRIGPLPKLANMLLSDRIARHHHVDLITKMALPWIFIRPPVVFRLAQNIQDTSKQALTPDSATILPAMNRISFCAPDQDYLTSSV